MSMTESTGVGEAEGFYPPSDQGFGSHETGSQEHWAGRMPPQDTDAEQSVLGSMLISKDAIADVLEVAKAQDFYKPAHETIFDAVTDLYSRGEPADPVTVAAELQRRGELQRVGGAPYLHTL
jgi:replicative DNA helicase